MLNPFAIEKDILAKTAALSGLLGRLKGAVVLSVIDSHSQDKPFSTDFVIECLEVREKLENSSRLYVCKVCGKEFDEGRKLGGHVSRAHKGAGSMSSFQHSQQDSSEEEVYRPRASRRVRVKVEEVDWEEQETGYKRVKYSEPIYEEP